MQSSDGPPIQLTIQRGRIHSPPRPRRPSGETQCELSTVDSCPRHLRATTLHPVQCVAIRGKNWPIANQELRRGRLRCEMRAVRSFLPARTGRARTYAADKRYKGSSHRSHVSPVSQESAERLSNVRALCQRALGSGRRGKAAASEMPREPVPVRPRL